LTDKPTLAIVGGTGALGTGLASRLARAGYPIVIGSRDAISLTLLCRHVCGCCTLLVLLARASPLTFTKETGLLPHLNVGLMDEGRLARSKRRRETRWAWLWQRSREAHR
jgi:hypothetical protein